MTEPVDRDGAPQAPVKRVSARVCSGRVNGPRITYPTQPSSQQLPGGKSRVVDRSTHFKFRLDYILATVGNTKADSGRVASHRTREERKLVLFRLFEWLRSEAGFKLEDPQNLEARHLRVICAHWESRWRLGLAHEANGLSSTSIANMASVLRQFCTWIHQPQLVEAIAFSTPNVTRRRLATTRNKAWEAAGVDPLAMIERAWVLEPFVGVMLLLQFTLGLREREAAMFRPAVAHCPGEPLVKIGARRHRSGKRSGGSKGARPRVTFLVADWEIRVLAFVHAFCQSPGGRHGSVGPESRRLDQNLGRYGAVLAKLGLTKASLAVVGHGLRAGFAIRRLHQQGHWAPVEGGDLMTIPAPQRHLLQRAIMEDLGHSRAQVASAYYGSVRAKGNRSGTPPDPDSQLGPAVEALLDRFGTALLRIREERRLIDGYARLVK